MTATPHRLARLAKLVLPALIGLLGTTGCDSATDDGVALRSYRVGLTGTPGADYTCSVVRRDEGGSATSVEEGVLPAELGPYAASLCAASCYYEASDSGGGGRLEVRLLVDGEVAVTGQTTTEGASVIVSHP